MVNQFSTCFQHVCINCSKRPNRYSTRFQQHVQKVVQQMSIKLFKRLSNTFPISFQTSPQTYVKQSTNNHQQVPNNVFKKRSTTLQHVFKKVARNVSNQFSTRFKHVYTSFISANRFEPFSNSFNTSNTIWMDPINTIWARIYSSGHEAKRQR